MKLASILILALCSWHALGQSFEHKVVAAVLMAEAWNQGQTGMIAVAEVIHQRAVESDETPLQVVTKGKFRYRAFSSLNGRTPAGLVKKFQGKADYKLALAIAVQMAQWPVNRPGITRSATHFTRKEEKPYWAKGYRPVAIIGDHAFYRLPWLL